jgi:3-deoxy-D-manno-octulosonate 8-phosphate phosphatase (KDO 8-P phosphatase)
MDKIQEPLSQRCIGIELLVVDVDGVLTDGGIVYGDHCGINGTQGTELKRFHVRDGSAIKLWCRQGKKAAILTGRTSRVVERRAAELGIRLLVQGADDKLAGFRQIIQNCGVQPHQVCCVGDDLPDLPVLANCGLAVAVADASPEIIAIAHYVTRLAGGTGAVREVVEMLLRAQGSWDGIIAGYRNRKLDTHETKEL